jgi:proline dehydrogenase
MNKLKISMKILETMKKQLTFAIDNIETYSYGSMRVTFATDEILSILNKLKNETKQVMHKIKEVRNE